MSYLFYLLLIGVVFHFREHENTPLASKQLRRLAFKAIAAVAAIYIEANIIETLLVCKSIDGIRFNDFLERLH